MTKAVKVALALGAAMSWAAAGEARKTPSIWVQCDGYPKPEPDAAKMVRSLAALSTLGLFGVPEGYKAAGRADGAAGVAACRAALADPAAAAAPPLRRVLLNKALAIHQLEAKNPAGALAALDAAAAEVGGFATNPYFARSTGVSLDLVRAVAQLRLGQIDQAMASAARAAAARPFSARVQKLAIGIMGLDAEVQPEEQALAERLVKLDPSSADALASLHLRAGRHAEAWALLKRQNDLRKPVPSALAAFASRDAGVGRALVAAFAAARAGDTASAGKILDDQVALAGRAAAELGKMKLKISGAAANQPLGQALARPIEDWRSVVEAAGLMASGDAAAAQAKLNAAKVSSANPLVELLAADIRAKLPPEARLGIVAAQAADPAKKAAERLARIEELAGPELFALLPEPEDASRLNSYSKQIGFFKGTGFKHKQVEGGLTRIEFVGSSSSLLAVEEMALLRAADLARQGGYKTFTIERRSEYARWMQQTMRGVPIGKKTLVGFMTEMDVRYHDDPAVPMAHDAAAVAAALAPIYVRTKSAAR